MIARVCSVFAGVLILAAVAHVTVLSAGGYGTPHAWVTLAVAGGVACGAVVSGMAWADRRHALAVGFAFAIVAGDAYGLLATAERLVASREAAQAPLRAAEKAHADATKRTADARAKVAGSPISSARIARAEAAKAVADTAAVEKSTEAGCRVNCRQLLQAQVDGAAAEVEAARAELAQRRATAEKELQQAHAALAVLKAPVSATPLADRSGFPAWIIDLVHSALGSIAANGLACCLLIFGAHGRAPEPVCRGTKAAAEPTMTLAVEDVPRPVAAKQHAARFALACFRRGGEANLQSIRQRYAEWCATGSEQLPDHRIGAALAELFREAGIEIEERPGHLVAMGISLKESAALLAVEKAA